MNEERARIFVLKLRPLLGVDAIRALRHVLKRLLRTYGLRCIDLHEETEARPSRPDAGTLRSDNHD